MWSDSDNANVSELALAASVVSQYLYVIGFSHGVVKVGQTSKPHDRITYHTKNSNNYQRRVTATWVSSPCEGAGRLEKLLLDWCSLTETDHGLRSKEYFELPFDAVVAQAKHLVELYQPLMVPSVQAQRVAA